MNNEILNTCYLALQGEGASIKTIASYSHLVPTILSLILGIFVFFKAKFNLFSKVFLVFIVTFSLWLIGDVIAWTSNNYHLVYTTWSFLDYTEIMFYVLGLYFVMVFVKKSDISKLIKVGLFILTIPVFYLTITQQSVTGFFQPWCEASNNELLGQYKLIVEGIILLIILFYTIVPFIKKHSLKEKKTNLIMLGSMFLFLSVFGVTEYIASITGVYEYNLYSLFLLPVFLIAIIYSVFELDIFNVKILSTYYLVFGLMILMGGQLFFVNSTADQLLTGLTILITIGLSFILFKNLKRESDQRLYIQKLNVKLEALLAQRESLTHLVTHKVKGSFTRSKYIFAEMLEGTFGKISKDLKDMAEKGLRSDNEGIDTVDLVLNAANLQTGTVKYEMKPIDFKEIVLRFVEEKKGPAELKGLKFETDIKSGDYNMSGDAFWLKEVVHNLIDNSVKYTKEGSIKVGLEKKENKILFYVKDTGVGINAEDKKNLFKEGGRGKNSVSINVDSTGYGLFTVKLIVDAHKGKIWAESEGDNKGTTFFVELNAI